MRITARDLRMMILEERRKLLKEEDNPVTATSSGDMRSERRLPVVNMNRLRRTDREIADWMERDNPELRGKIWGPVDRYNQAVQELNVDVSAANSPVEVMETENVPDVAVPTVEISVGSLDVPIPHYVTTSEDDEWNYKVVADVWYTQKKADLNRVEDANDTDDWISLGGDRENFVKASEDLDSQFGDMRSQSARSETSQQHTANQRRDDEEEEEAENEQRSRGHIDGEVVEWMGIRFKKEHLKYKALPIQEMELGLDGEKSDLTGLEIWKSGMVKYWVEGEDMERVRISDLSDATLNDAEFPNYDMIEEDSTTVGGESETDDDDGESDSSGNSTASGISDRNNEVSESAVRRWGKLAGILKG